MDDDKLHGCIDFNDFEERFKIGSTNLLSNGLTETDGLQTFPSKRNKKQENVTLLEHTRLRNIGKDLALTFDIRTLYYANVVQTDVTMTFLKINEII